MDNYLIWGSENQGCWLAGIKATNLGQPDSVVYYNDNDDMYHWASFADSMQSFLLGIILEVLECETGTGTYRTINPEYMQKILDEADVDFQRLREPRIKAQKRFVNHPPIHPYHLLPTTPYQPPYTYYYKAFKSPFRHFTSITL